MSLIIFSTCIVVLPIIIGIIRYSKLSTIQKLLFWMVVLICINQGIGSGLKNFSQITNDMPLYRLYMFIEFVGLSLIYYRLIDKVFTQRLIQYLGVVFLIWWTIDFLPNNLWNYPELLRFFQSILILAYAGTYFYLIFKEGRIRNLLSESSFWISVGLIVYFASNSLLFLFSEFVVTLSDPSYYLIWTVHAFLTILLYIAYSIAIQCKTNHNLS